MQRREEIAQLTARLRREHEEYESASESWGPEAEGKKKELRKARADTVVEITIALARLGAAERVQEIERLPFEQKLARLEAFLEDLQAASPAHAEEASASPEAADVAIDAVDAAWDDEETEPVSADEVDAGWGDEEAEPDEEADAEPEWRGLTPEEREARAARAAARREKRRAKTTEKAERRKARASMAKGKQKQKTRRPPSEPEARRPSPPRVGEPIARESLRPREALRAPVTEVRAASRRTGRWGLAFLVAIVLVAGGVTFLLWRR